MAPNGLSHVLNDEEDWQLHAFSIKLNVSYVIRRAHIEGICAGCLPGRCLFVF